MDYIDQLWHLHDDLSIHEASCLIAGFDPFDDEHDGYDFNGNEIRPMVYLDSKRYKTVKSALIKAVTFDQLKAQKVHDVGSSYNLSFNAYPKDDEQDEVIQLGDDAYCYLKKDISVDKTTIQIDDLKTWLRGRGVTTGFLFEGESLSSDEPDYLNRNHPRYSPKLEASIRAWQAMEDNSLLNGKAPKQALEKWLRENGANYGLTKDDGNPNELGIEECTKVANWNTKGGATKTPTKKQSTDNKKQQVNDNLPTQKENLPTPKQNDINQQRYDESIPF